MDKMRGDMGGAACTLAAIQTAAMLNLSINIKGIILNLVKLNKCH